MKRKNSQIGKRAEALAVNYLKSLGYRIVTCNYFNRFGEIDIIATDRETLTFIEVKYRRSTAFGQPQEFVAASKLTKIRLAIGDYLKRYRIKQPLRIDVVAISGELDRPHIELIRNATLP